MRYQISRCAAIAKLPLALGGLAIALSTACTPQTASQSSTAPASTPYTPAIPAPTPDIVPLRTSGATGDPIERAAAIPRFDSATEPTAATAPTPFSSSSSGSVSGSTALSSSSGLAEGTAEERSRQAGSALSGDVSALESALQELGATVVGNEIQIDLPSDILFDFDQAAIRPDAAATLNKLLIIIKAQGDNSRIRIEGHTDAVGNDAYNQTLSERRASSVKDWLVNEGVASSQLTTRGFGESKPVAPNINPNGSDNPQGRQQNRRVQVFIRKG